jgi:ribonuclease HI
MIFLLIERGEKPSPSVILFTDADNIDIRRDGLTDLADSPRILVYTDGAARGNPGPAAIGYAIFDPDGNCIEQDGRYIGPHTNNEAEYEALLWALGAASKHTHHNVKFHSDSELIVYQVNGVYRVKKDHLREYVERIRKATEAFNAFKLVHVPRENPNIQKVDGLVNRVLDERER